MIKIKAKDLNENIFKQLDDNYALITAGGRDSYNCMTVSWGGVGVLWNKMVCFLFVRKTRYTKELIDKNLRLTLSLFDGNYKENLIKAGRITGRNIDKFKEVELTPIYDVDNDIYYAKEAEYVLKLKKIYVGEILPEGFIDKSLDEKNYPNKDYHSVYVCEITSVLKKEDE